MNRTAIRTTGFAVAVLVVLADQASKRLVLDLVAQHMPPAIRVTGFFNLVQVRSEEHTSELQSLMRISYAVFCLKNKNQKEQHILLHNVSIVNNHERRHDM